MNKISEFIKSREQKNFVFKPTPEFYNKTGIRRRRWAQIFRKEVSPSLDELTSLSKYFEVNVSDLFD